MATYSCRQCRHEQLHGVHDIYKHIGYFVGGILTFSIYAAYNTVHQPVVAGLTVVVVGIAVDVLIVFPGESTLVITASDGLSTCIRFYRNSSLREHAVVGMVFRFFGFNDNSFVALY